MEVSQPDQLKRFVPLRGGTVTDVCTIYYVGIFPMQSVLFRYVHPARRVTSPLSGRKGHVYNDCISISSTYNILSSSLPESPILPQNQNKWCLAIFWFNELPFKRLKIDHEFSTCTAGQKCGLDFRPSFLCQSHWDLLECPHFLCIIFMSTTGVNSSI